MMQRRGFASVWITGCIKGFHCVVGIVLFLDFIGVGRGWSLLVAADSLGGVSTFPTPLVLPPIIEVFTNKFSICCVQSCQNQVEPVAKPHSLPPHVVAPWCVISSALYFAPLNCLPCPSSLPFLLCTWDFLFLFFPQHFFIVVFCCSVAQSCPTLQPCGLQHARLPCPSLAYVECSALIGFSFKTISEIPRC